MFKNFQRRRLTVVEQGSLGDHGEELEGDLHLHVRLVRRKGEKEPLIKIRIRMRRKWIIISRD